MLIVSKFHDYYDSSMGVHGIDKTIVYERHTKMKHFNKHGDTVDWDKKNSVFDIFEEKYKANFGQRYRPGILSYDDNHNGEYFIVGFCGYTYLGFRYKPYLKDPIYYYGEDILKFFNRYKKRRLHKNPSKSDLNNISIQFNKVKNWINLIHGAEVIEQFREYNTPIFIEMKNAIEINPKLLDWRFVDVFSSYAAFQLIQSFISGVLGTNENKVLDVDEKHRIAQHGMDKWSFRNPDPPKRKQKKK